MFRKTILLLSLLVGLLLAAPMGVQAFYTDVESWGGPWVPTDGNVNFKYGNLFFDERPINFFITSAPGNEGDTVSVTFDFDDTENLAATFSHDADKHTLNYDGNVLQLADNDRFWLGYENYYEEDIYEYDFFQYDDSQNTLMFNELEIPVDMTDASPAPVPAAAWILGAGLLGLAGYRKKFGK